MAKTKLFESWTFRLQLPPPFDDPKYSGAKPMGFSQYNTSSTAQKATLHAPTLRALLAYAKLVGATENGQSVDDLGAIGHQGNTYRISELPTRPIVSYSIQLPASSARCRLRTARRF